MVLFGGLPAVDLQSAWPGYGKLTVSFAGSGVQNMTQEYHRADTAIVPEEDLSILSDTANRKMTCLSRGRTRFQWAPVRLRLRPLQRAIS